MALQTCELSSASTEWLIAGAIQRLGCKNKQLEIIHAFISERDIFDILPTGFGKSLFTCVCFDYLM